MAQAGDHLAFRPHDQQHRADLRTTTAVSCKRKASSCHPEATPATRRGKTIIEDEDALAGQIIERAGATAAKSSGEPAKLVGGSAASKNSHGTRRSETEDSLLLYGDETASKNGGTTAPPIVIGDGDLPCPEPEPAATWHGDSNTVVSPFGYTTWDPTDGGRYELLSTYTPPQQCLDADEEDALWWLAAAYTAPELYTSPANVFWGTPDGVWTLW
jgi:hypothetical protein